ncbi:MAG: rRNA maturation RNase YbeY [Clostridiales bacterium]|jgi:probable rRNA maturation factor|nr:rRNA maturation RNase YbeY [Clostridiales bacterium]
MNLAIYFNPETDLSFSAIGEWPETTEELPPRFKDILTNAVILGLTHCEMKSACELSVVLMSAEEIQKFNRDYRHVDRVTDVLSFPLAELEDEPQGFDDTPEDEPAVLGDILICVSRAREQAEELGHSLLRELAFLTVHGLLHLLGYDHENAAGEAEMIRLQTEILNKAGITREE